MNPFSTPDRIVVLTRPQDMRAGIRRLSAIVAAELGEDSMSGDLYVFVSRNCRRIKMIRFETNAWCMWTLNAVKGGFRWRTWDAGATLEVERRQLMFLLEGLEMMPKDAPSPVAAHTVL